jgi:hypothetical protein
MVSSRNLQPRLYRVLHSQTAERLYTNAAHAPLSSTAMSRYTHRVNDVRGQRVRAHDEVMLTMVYRLLRVHDESLDRLSSDDALLRVPGCALGSSISQV